MSEVKKQLFIINKFAGTDFEEKLEGRILDACIRNNAECTIEYTKGRGHASELARQGVQNNFDTVVAVGGDGTVNEVAVGLIGSSIPMGILPNGSGNGLARHLGIPLKLDKALDCFFEGTVLAMDTFTLNDKLSLNVSGIGFDGHISNLFDKERQRGFWGYFKLVIKEYLNFKEFSSEIIIDRQASNDKAFIIAIANSSQYGNNARISPTASVSDNLLNVVLLKKVKLTKSIPFAYKMFTGTLSVNDVHSLVMGKDIKITTLSPVAYHIDGEPRGYANDFVIRINPNSLNVVVPTSKPF